MADEFIEYKGISNLVYAPLTGEGDDEAYGEVKRLAGVRSLTKETEEASEQHYYDNLGRISITAEGVDTYTLSVSVAAHETRAALEGLHWDGAGRYLAKVKLGGVSRKGYFALGYLADTTDGKQVCVWVYKGKFTGGGQTHDTADGGTAASGVDYTFTAVPTGRRYTVNNRETVAKSLEAPADAIAPEDFFAQVLTPDMIPLAPSEP